MGFGTGCSYNRGTRERKTVRARSFLIGHFFRSKAMVENDISCPQFSDWPIFLVGERHFRARSFCDRLFCFRPKVLIEKDISCPQFF